MKYAPRRHQILAERWLREHERCALFLDMGLGKTVVTLTVLRERIYDDFSVDRALPCIESSLVLLEDGVCYDQCIFLPKL